MAREIDLLGYWMPVLRQLKEFKEIAKAETPELKYILEQIERTLNNMFIETADEYGIKRFEDMNMMRHTKTLGIVEVDSTVWKKLSEDEKAHILSICDKNLDEYYARIK